MIDDLPSGPIACVVAHPDDEVLAFGGALTRHAEAGHAVSVLFLATGLAARGDGAPDAAALEDLRARARAAGAVLGVDRLEFEDFPDNRMDSVALLDVIKRVEAFLADTGAATVYTHHAGDLNIDHAVVARATLTACRPLPGATARRVYAGEVPSSSEWAAPGDRFQPTSYLDIADCLDRKCRALECYAGELRPWPHPRSVEGLTHLARLRGGEAGLEAAEAYRLLREIRR